MANNVRYTAAKRREIAAQRAAELDATLRSYAAMTVDEYLAQMAAEYGVTHNSNIAAGEDVEWFRAHHAELVARYRAA